MNEFGWFTVNDIIRDITDKIQQMAVHRSYTILPEAESEKKGKQIVTVG